MPGGGGGRKAAASAAVEEEAAESAEAAAVGCGDTFIGDASTLAQADEESPSDGDPGHALEVTGPVPAHALASAQPHAGARPLLTLPLSALATCGISTGCAAEIVTV
jgi:hypothetical protein